MPIQLGAKGATIAGVNYPPYQYIDWLTPDQEQTAVQGGDAVRVPGRRVPGDGISRLDAAGAAVLPAAMQDGRPILFSGGASPVQTAEGITIDAGSGQRAWYAEVALEGPVTRMGCEFKMGLSNGTAGAAVCLIPWLTANAFPAIPATGIHFVVTRQGWSIDYFDALLANKVTYATGRHQELLGEEDWYQVEWARVGGVLTVRVPDGSTVVITEPQIVSRVGPYACAEVYQNVGTTDARPTIRRFWASAGDVLTQVDWFGRAVSEARAQSLHITSGATTSVPQGSAGDFLAAGTRVFLPKGPTGRTWVRLSAFITNLPAGGDLIWTLRVTGASGGTLFQNPAYTVARAGATGRVDLDVVLSPNADPSYLTWQHWCTVAGATMDVQASRPAVVVATPV